MAATKVIQVSFGGGEISPSMYGRRDDLRYQNGLKKCQNFVTLPQGPIRNRPGLEFVRECGNESKAVRLIPFQYSSSQTMVIELGDKYARFHSLGATLVNDNDTPYQISTPWAAADLFELAYTQSGDVLTVTHANYPPYEIRRYAVRDWRIVSIALTPKLATPGGVTAVRATSAANDANSEKYTFKYKVSCLNADKSSESEPSAAVSVVANIYAYGTTVKISCNRVAGASFYRFYKNNGGVYGYIGDSEDPEIIDDNVAAQTGTTTRRFDYTLAQAGNYPRAVGYFEQRRVFAGLASDPQRVMLTRTGTESDMSYSLPTKDDDRISFRIASREYNAIRHVVPLSQLILLTSGTEYRVSPLNTDAITPSSISVRPVSNYGASHVTPQVVDNSVVYVASRGNHVRSLNYQYAQGGFVSNDLCLRSTHLFDFKEIRDSAQARAPYPLLWFVSSDGSLLGLTYLLAEEVAAWHRHVTDGAFESITCVSEGVEDHLYCVVRRTVNGKTRRYIERMKAFDFEKLEDAFFVDCGVTYEGPAATVISGLDWLEGKTVSILADGAVMPQQVVKGGKVNLTYPAKKVTVGLPYVADAQTLPIALQDTAMGMGRNKNITQAHLQVYKSSNVKVGYSFDDMTEYKQRMTERPGSAPALMSKEIEVRPLTAWTESGSFCFRQDEPLPLILQSISLTVTV